jgi:cellulose synthase/poly-beta-1,6-N-acetylglucosamine synthase-like glycosyltransferase
MQELALFFLQATAVYFICINALYAMMLILSWLEIKRFNKKVLSNKVNPEQLPPVSFIVPAFNEESLIVETIQTYLSLPQTKKEIIVINDGSHDQTFRMLQMMFQLRRMDPKSTAFRSITYPELTVLEAPHMGKAQALNFGVAHASYDLICTMDADTIPTARGVEACLRSFANHPHLIAAGGVIQVLNSQILKENSPVDQKPHGWLTTFQSIEYLRTFLCERLGWSLLSSTTLISGAFCMVKKSAIQRVGGFLKDSITEDLDMIVRLRKEFSDADSAFKILPITTCFTQAPDQRRHLMVQRMRWQMGLVQTLLRNMELCFNPKFRILGMVAIPYAWLVEVFSPVLSVLAVIVIPFALITGWIQLTDVLIYLVLGLAFNSFITMAGIYLDGRYVSRTRNWSVMRSLRYTFLLLIGYRQLTTWWRFLALTKSMKRGYHWGEKPRKEIIHL